MKLYRQDGSEVELTEEDAQKWLAIGLATAEQPKHKSEVKAKTKQTAEE